MKSRKQIIRQYIVLSLLVIYQAASLIHIASMPRFYTQINKSLSSSSIDLLHKNQSAGNARILFQRGIENNRKALITPPDKIFVFILSFFLGGLISLAIIKKRDTYLSQPGILSPSSYLRLCTLRI
ncbi:putative alpha/beta superfamily hydrolase [Mucilaginibacter lappiensis]|uniref:Alpha/beta superfamily hydrolase n=1 Tax=Mucilaginibacter lappiensis TaxID=354630 RepID=A0ABR6PHE4_9SPHI|nr:putative alpha/beta superfamily hydrolase [Mucilaginibacter lappiensis]